MRRFRAVAVVVVLLAGAVALVAVFLSDDEGDAKRDEAGAISRPLAVRGCRERVEGGRIYPRRGRDTLLGPVTFPYLPANYRGSAKPDPLRDPPPRGLNDHPFKALLLVDAGRRVTVVVPKDQRSWMRLFYHPSDLEPGGKGTFEVTLQACQRPPSRGARRRECRWTPMVACSFLNTQFNGGLYVDFDRAPARGRCARLIVRVAGGESVAGRAFGPRVGCS